MIPFPPLVFSVMFTSISSPTLTDDGAGAYFMGNLPPPTLRHHIYRDFILLLIQFCHSKDINRH